MKQKIIRKTAKKIPYSGIINPQLNVVVVVIITIVVIVVINRSNY